MSARSPSVEEHLGIRRPLVHDARVNVAASATAQRTSLARTLAATFVLMMLGLVVVIGACGKDSSRGGHELDIDANTRFHIQDRLGSASLVLDHEGKVIARSAHAPYGERWIDEQTEGTRPSDYRFTDKEEDLLSGAIYIGARHYLPAVGRWASPDPALLTSNLVTKDPREGNPYQYTLSNPVNGTDPIGLDTTGEVIDQHKERAEANDRTVEAVAWSVLGAAWSVLGAENLSKVVDNVINDRDDMTPGDYAAAAVESTAVVGVAANGIKKLGSAITGVARRIVGTRHSAAQTAATTKSAAGGVGLPGNTLVCRGGTCTAERFAQGSGGTVDASGRLQGISVNSAPGATVKELTSTIPNKQVGVTTVDHIRVTLCDLTPSQAEQLFTPTIQNPSVP